ncbi:hypothetical protein BH20ACT8_BH20ACT8_14750 [soil metagenome]|jgi:DNA-binding transcriptional ArsR family regulator
MSVAERLQVIAEPHRLMILRHLRRGDQYAGRLAEALDISPSLASHHLTTLIAAGFVTREQKGPYACYSAKRDAIEAFHAEIGQLIGAIVPEDALEVAEVCDTE